MATNPYIELSHFTGINNIADSKSLNSDFNTGKGADLVSCVNVNIDNDGIIHRRDGVTSINGTSTHSLYANKNGTIILYMQGTTLYSGIGSDKHALRIGLAVDLPMYYAEIGDNIIYSNGQIIEYTLDGFTSISFRTQFDINQSYSPLTNKEPMLAGTMLQAHNERLYVVNNNTIYYSDAMNFVSMDKENYYLLVDDAITMFISVVDGFWVSYGGNTYFIDGNRPQGIGLDPLDFVIKPKSNHKALGQAVIVDALTLGVQTQGKTTVAWLGTKGVVVGDNVGMMYPLSIDRYQLNGNVVSAVTLFKQTAGQAYLINCTNT